MKVLADSSVWIDYLRRAKTGSGAALDGLIERREVVVCGPVVLELLSVARAARRAELRRGLLAMEWAPIGRQGWYQSSDLAHALRSQGSTVPLLDVLIAVAAVNAGVDLWTFDRHFDTIHGVLPELRLHVP